MPQNCIVLLDHKNNFNPNTPYVSLESYFQDYSITTGAGKRYTVCFLVAYHSVLCIMVYVVHDSTNP